MTMPSRSKGLKLGEHEASLDGFAQANFVGKQGSLGQGRAEREECRVDLVGIQVHLCAGHGSSKLVALSDGQRRVSS